MPEFTPLASLAGGMLIGLAAVVLMLLNGRIAGISGITASLLSVSRAVPDRGWRLAFVAGLILAPLGLAQVEGAPAMTVAGSPAIMALAGFLVGFGTVLGNGCTSGHGICGIARLSPRSVAATGVFMAAGIATVFVVRHLLAGG
ncbi:MAG: YeeE/YedE family protein [Rhodospirillaceae bacterium]|nr:YeeE/YedE family protein [Rhodospirillaceae bacterium]